MVYKKCCLPPPYLDFCVFSCIVQYNSFDKMHHIQSMRDAIRAPTAASIENPLAPVSLAKSRRFISNNVGESCTDATLCPTSPNAAQAMLFERPREAHWTQHWPRNWPN